MQQDFFLIHKMKNGDEAAMDDFVRKYYPQILQYCRYHCPDRQWAQDLTQETFERFFRNLADYQHIGKAACYLYTVARNLCIDWERKNRERPIGAVGTDVSEKSEENCGNVLNFGNAANGERTESDRSDERMLIEDALLRLPDELREVVILHYFQEFSLKEISEILKISIPLAKYRMKRAREQLRKLLEKDG